MKNVVSTDFSVTNINNAKKILFTLFTRYGDTIISLVVIKEFIEKYNNKEYLILCPKQMLPYVNELLPHVKVIAFNKRNIYEFIKVNLLLKKERFDIGFNPWSNGIDSCYLISFCKNFLCYKEFTKQEIINHYNVVREYLKLQPKVWKNYSLKEKVNYKKVLICPQSTDEFRSLSKIELQKLVKKLLINYSDIKITIASMNEEDFIEKCKRFKFKKSSKSSSDFISLIKSSDLVICVDSGPLHIATALKKDTLALFNTTKAELVIDTESKVNIEKKVEYCS